MEAITPEEINTVRRHLQHQRIYGPDRFRLAVEQRLRRKLGPKKVGQPQKKVIDTGDLPESRL